MPDHAVEAILRALPGMDRARVVSGLADGPTNTTFLVQSGDDRFVLRLDKPQAGVLGLNRDRERAVCRALAKAGLAPAFLYWDLAEGVCLRPFIEGRCLGREDLLEEATLRGLAATLRRLHGLPPVGARFDPAASAQRYAGQLATPEAARLARRVEEKAVILARQPARLALCHNDLVAENMLASAQQEVLLIDWEYAAVGDPLFDLAVVVRHHGLGRDLARSFLEDYLQRPPTAAEAQRFSLQCGLYDALLALWNLRVGN